MKDVLGRRRRSFAALAFVAALAATLVVSVTPASARSSRAAVASPICNPVSSPGAELFDGLARLTPASVARGTSTLREPNLGQVAVSAPRAKARPGAATTVETWVHVVSPDGTTGNVSNGIIQAQMRVLNLAFAGFYGGADTGFRFDLAGVTRSVNEAWYLTGPGTAAEAEMKQALKVDGSNTLNVYLTTAGPYLGWAYLPSIVGTSFEYLDGVVVDWESLPGASDRYEDQYDLGHTLTHETGHWLNLLHTFDGGCGSTGDEVEDTPAERTPTAGCPADKDTCVGKPGLDPIHNYLDYSFDSCYSEFTPGQATRMFDAWSFWRA
jgi:Pregnancy-associated plasma protein-A